MRPWVLMKELNIPFREQLLLMQDDSNGRQFKEWSPNGKLPCLQTNEGKVWETLAIAEFLAEKFLGVWPVDTVKRMWARSVASEMHSGFSALRTKFPMICNHRYALKYMPSDAQLDLARLMEVWLEGRSWFGGPFLTGDTLCAVDAFFVPVAIRCQTYSLPLSLDAQQYVTTLIELPSVKDWVRQAKEEPWRLSYEDKLNNTDYISRL